MGFELGVAATVFGLVFLLELPDKTMVATLFLSSRYRPLPVLVGAGSAFAVQMALAVTVGGALRLLPEAVTLSVVAAMFALGAFLLVRESMSDDDDDEEKATPPTTVAWRIALISFGVLLLAEFGDGSQIATAASAARYGAPVSVFVGAWLAEVSVCVIAAVAGRALLRAIPVRWVQRAAAVIFAGFAVWALVELFVR